MRSGSMSYGKMIGEWKKGDVVSVAHPSGTMIFIMLSDPHPVSGLAIWFDKFGYNERLADKRSWSNDSIVL